jgi:hypothetical protein
LAVGHVNLNQWRDQLQRPENVAGRRPVRSWHGNPLRSSGEAL